MSQSQVGQPNEQQKVANQEMVDQSWIEVEELSPKVVAPVKSDPSNQLAVEGPALVISLIDDDEERYPDTVVLLQTRDEEDIEDVHIESYIDGRQIFYK